MLSSRTINRLNDIHEDARRIETFIEDMSLYDFTANERTVFAVERLLQRITEAAIQIDPKDASEIGHDLPISQMRALGNKLRHEYRIIDHSVIFDIARVEVPALAYAIDLILGTHLGLSEG